VRTAEAKVACRCRIPGDGRKRSLGGLAEAGRESLRSGFVGWERADLVAGKTLCLVAWVSCLREEVVGDG